MNILLDPEPLLFWLTAFTTLVLLLLAIRFAPWRQLISIPVRQHAFFAAILVLAILWLLRVTVKDAIAFHPMLMTVTTMVFGWSLALIIGAAALVALAFYQLAFRLALTQWDVAWGQFDLNTFPLDFCLDVAVPVGWTWCVIWLVNRWHFKNPFTYFLGVGFFGAMTTCLLTDVTALSLFFIFDSEPQLAVMQEHFFSFLLMTFPEGFINGTIATALTVLWPDIVKTYQDEWFLKG